MGVSRVRSAEVELQDSQVSVNAGGPCPLSYLSVSSSVAGLLLQTRLRPVPSSSFPIHPSRSSFWHWMWRQWYLLVCDTVNSGRQISASLLPLFSKHKDVTYPEEGGKMLLRNSDTYPLECTASHPVRPQSSWCYDGGIVQFCASSKLRLVFTSV